MCNHAYAIPRGDLWFCLKCKALFKKEEEPEEELVMPPKIYEITERLWKLKSPWPHIPLSITEKYNWYLSLINSKEYLVMPIVQKGKPVYFSARLLEKGTGLKYLYPKGVKKSYWTSSDNLEGSPIIICEGVADAAYCSLIGPSLALLGSHYNSSLNHLFAGRPVVICLDGDAAGIFAAIVTKKKLTQEGISSRIVILPNKKDPTDLSIEELRGAILHGGEKE